MAFKRKIAAVLALALALFCGAMSGCGAPKPSGPVSLTVWGSQQDQDLLTEMANAYIADMAARSDVPYSIKVEPVEETDAVDKFLGDPASAADVFAFPADDIGRLTDAGGLLEISKDAGLVKNSNTSASVAAATVGGKLYACPMTADSGYFLYYDKSVISADQVKSLDGILSACQAANKKMYMDVSNGWYIASFFLGAGCRLSVGADGSQKCDFNSDAGISAGEAIKVFTASPAFLTGNDATLTDGFANRTVAAGVSGLFSADAVKTALGGDFGAAKLPTFTSGGKQVQMGSFAGFTLVGVNKNTAFPDEATELAEWLTNEQNQLKRFQAGGLLPSNKNAAHAAAADDPALSALAAQNAFGVSENGVTEGYWAPAAAFGAAMEGKNYNQTVAALLNDMVAKMAGK